MKTPSFLATALLIFPGVSSAVTLTTFAFGTGPSAPATVNGVTATTISYGSGLGTARTSAATFAPSGANALGLITNAATPTTVADAVTANSFFTFSITPAAGTSIQLIQFSLWANYSTNQESANELALQINTGSGFQTIGTTTFDVTGGATGGAQYFIPITGFDNVTGTAQFRVVMYDSAGVTWNLFTRIDDMTITGNIIPEPSSALLIAAVSVLGLRRKRSR